MDKTKYTKKEIKAIKKYIIENGFIKKYKLDLNVKNIITFDEIVEKILILNENIQDFKSIKLEHLNYFIISEVIEKSNYQNFKNRFFDYIIES